MEKNYERSKRVAALLHHFESDKRKLLKRFRFRSSLYLMKDLSVFACSQELRYNETELSRMQNYLQ